MSKTLYIVLGIIALLLVGFFVMKTTSVGNVVGFGKADLSHFFNYNINQTFGDDVMKQGQISCIDIDGEWFDTASKVGCFNTVDEQPISECNKPMQKALKTLCNSLEAKWICDKNNVGCYY